MLNDKNNRPIDECSKNLTIDLSALSTRWSLESQEDLLNIYGIQLEDEIISIMSREEDRIFSIVSKEIASDPISMTLIENWNNHEYQR